MCFAQEAATQGCSTPSVISPTQVSLTRMARMLRLHAIAGIAGVVGKRLNGGSHACTVCDCPAGARRAACKRLTFKTN